MTVPPVQVQTPVKAPAKSDLDLSDVKVKTVD